MHHHGTTHETAQAPELPANNWLGYAIDMLSATPMDITSVSESVKKARKIIKYDPDERTRVVEIDKGVQYTVPWCIGVMTDVTRNDGALVTFRTGSEASEKFENDASLSAKYLAVSGSVSTQYATEKAFRRENQYSFYSLNSEVYQASLREYADLLNEDALKSRVKQLPKPFDPTKPNEVKDWKDFFATFGTHVIVNCTYGARFQLNVWASNSESSVNTRFALDVQASFNGVTSGGKVDEHVKDEAQYKEFEAFMQKIVSVEGGSKELATSLAIDPTQYDLYKEWAKTVSQNPNLANFDVIELWALLRDAKTKALRDAADAAEDAFVYLSTHKDLYETRVTLSIESDWAEFGLLTPSALIVEDKDFPYPSNTVQSQTRVQWGKEHSHDYKREDVRFKIINDGSPIDFYISHGSSGAKKGSGRAMVLIGEDQYVNDKITDNNWNTVWYFQKPSDGTKISTSLTASGKSRKWQDVVDNYLSEHHHNHK